MPLELLLSIMAMEPKESYSNLLYYYVASLGEKYRKKYLLISFSLSITLSGVCNSDDTQCLIACTEYNTTYSILFYLAAGAEATLEATLGLRCKGG